MWVPEAEIISFLEKHSAAPIHWQDTQEMDLAMSYRSVRLRVHAFRTYQGWALAIRLLSRQIPTLQHLNLPPIFKKITAARQGLVIITGPTGSGKSTTLAAMIEEINRTRPVNIITIEDPIEYVYEPKMALIQQREIRTHTNSFARALRAALREDPDVILVGEMRDLETIRAALEAAETGHLVLSTLHTNSAAETIEILVVNTAVRNLIRENKTFQIPSIIQTGSGLGMQTFQQHLQRIRQQGIVSMEFNTETVLGLMQGV